MAASLNSNTEFDLLVEKDHLKSVEQGPLQATVYSHVYLSHSGLVLQGLRPVSITFFEKISKKRHRQLVRYALYKKFTEPKIRMKEPIAAIHHIWSSGYHHWICECLVKALYLDSHDMIYLPEEYPAFAMESLQLMGFKKIQILKQRTGIAAHRLKLVNNPISGLASGRDLQRLRSVFKALVDPAQPPRPKIYISRKSASLRKVINEDAVIATLKRYHYHVLESEKLSFRDQVALYQSCRVLVSIHGAGLTNCLFMSEGAIIFEIYRKMESTEDYMNLCYYRMSKSLGHHYMIQFAEMVKGKSPNEKDRSDICVDLEAFEENLRLIESANIT